MVTLQVLNTVNPVAQCLDLDGGHGPNVGIYNCNHKHQSWQFTTPWQKGGVISINTTQLEGHEACLSDTSRGGSPVGDQRTIHVYADTPQVELLRNGKSLGLQNVSAINTGGPYGGSGQSYAEFQQIDFAPGSLIAHAVDATGAKVATHTVHTAEAAFAIKLSVDCPSARTGTGTKLLLDGQDAGLIRATIVDAKGNLVHNARHNVSFVVKSGPGAVVGAHSGDPQSHEPNQASSHTAYHGLVRAVIKVTKDTALPYWQRQRLAHIDVGRTDTVTAGAADGPIVIEAHAQGLQGGTVSIDVSVDEADSVLRAAEAYGTAAVLGFD
jgi:hypothetical protein